MKLQFYRDVPAEFGSSSLRYVTEDKDVHQKRTPVFDRLFALVVLVAVSPALAVIWGLIALGGRRPIFFQERIGYAGRPFQIFKFCTIPEGGWDRAERAAEASWIAGLRLSLFKQVSRVLRSTGLDELPQFVNILKGDMQIIGPRPLVLDDFVALPTERMERCAVPPGITGFAQINGGQDLDSASKLALDIYVIDHFSIGMTARIVWRTIVRIVRGSAATASANARDLARAQKHLAVRRNRRSRAVKAALENAVVLPTPLRRDVARFAEMAPHLQRVHVGPMARPHEIR